MGTNTDELLLPRPVGTDDANVVSWLTQLTDRLELILTAGHDSLWNTGDFKVSSQAASHGRWLICDGRELTQAEIETELGLDAGDGADIVALWGTGGSSIYGSAAASKVKLPDARGRAIVAVGAGAGLTARTRGSSFGAETHTLAANEGSVKNHTHGDGTLAAASHNHSDGTLAAASHNHDSGTYASDGTHTHNFLATTGAPSTTAFPAPEPGDFEVAGYNHTHAVGGTTNAASSIDDVTGNSGSTAPDVTGNTGSAAPDVAGSTGNPDGTSSGGTAATAAHNNVQPSFALGTLFVRV